MEKVNLAEVGLTDVAKTTRADRIRFRLKDLLAVSQKLDSWQSDFVHSLNSQFRQNHDLSNAQFKVLLNIWQDAHSSGLVKLPKGMF